MRVRRSACTWVYISVAEMSACPSRICTVRRSAPPSSRWVAKEWRRLWGEISFADAGLHGVALDELPHPLPGESLARSVEKKHVGLGRLESLAEHALQSNGLRRFWASVVNGHEPFLRAPCRRPCSTPVWASKSSGCQGDQLGHAQSCRVEQLEHGLVAKPQAESACRVRESRFSMSCRVENARQA